MASCVISLLTALIASLVCQTTTSSELKREARSYSETTGMYTENAKEDENNGAKLSNENTETYGMGGTTKNSRELNVELVSRIFDTSPLTLNKFMADNSNANKDNRYASDNTDGTNSYKKIQEAVEELRLQDSSISNEDVVKGVKRNESNENNDSGKRCDADKRDGKDCDDCKMAALENITSKENISSIPESVASMGNSSTGIISVNDTENFSKIIKKSDGARTIMKDFSDLSRMEVAARLFEDSVPPKTQVEAEGAEIKDYENTEHPIQSITMSFYKKLMPYMTDLPEVMESTEVTTAVESDLLHEAIESDTVTSNTEKPITPENENKKDLTEHRESLEPAATLKFADSDKVNKTLKNSVGKAVNSPNDKSNSQDVNVPQAPQARLYADDNGKKKQDGDEREIQTYLKKANDRWINIVINNYPPHVCNKEKM